MRIYKIQVKTIHNVILTYSVENYTIEEGDFVSFIDRKSGERRIFHASNCEIREDVE